MIRRGEYLQSPRFLVVCFVGTFQYKKVVLQFIFADIWQTVYIIEDLVMKNRRDIFKNLIFILEVLICIVAVIMILPKRTVSGYENEELISMEEVSPSIVSDEEPYDEIVPEEDEESDSENDDEADDDFDTDDLIPVEEDLTTINYPIDDWRLILVNKQNYIPDNYSVNLVNVNGSKQVDERIAADTTAMLEAAREDGVSLMIVSAYRSEERQISLFNSKVRRNMSRGMSYMDAYAEASYSVTVPGTSEHQLGLALDILGSGHSSMTESFADTPAGKWLRENCANYGFILRYPKDKECVTGIIYEPWHFRYVGKEYAHEIMDNGITLEEFVAGRQ